MTKLEKLSRQDSLQLGLSITFFLAIVFGSYQDLINYRQIGENLFAAIQFKYNFYFHLTSVGAFLASGYGNKVLLLFGVCCSYLILSRIYSDSIKTLAATLAGWLLILQIFKLDYSVLATLSFGAVYFMSLVALRNFRSATVSLFIVLSVLSWICLFNFALLSFLLGLTLFFIIGEHTENTALKEFPLNSKILVFMTLVLLFIANSTSPTLPFPDYPAAARLTQLFEAPGWYARPLIGPDNPLQTADRLSLRNDLGRLILPCFTGILLLLIRTRNFSKLVPLSGLLILLYCDLRLPESYSQVLPLQGLARLLPGITDMALVPIVLACLIFALTFLCLLRIKYAIYVFTAAISLLWLTDLTPVTSCEERFYGTPSCFVAKFFPAESLKIAESEFKKLKPKKDSLTVNSLTGSHDPAALVDRNPATRWSSGSGRQDGTEWLQIVFAQPHETIGIELQTGNFATDFPRGLEVYGGENCEQNKRLAQYNSWQGPLIFSEKGMPFFGQQSDVRIFFNEPVRLTCLKILQTSKSESFDWSVAEFRLLVTKSAEARDED